ncbi:hypothetical protein VE03_10653 [Pseudogymnoascus sp. 23342-1-I1]|nr:hypothetical protein VE03_10653 [Pseudogymnoascus sp. 23342-1-I1]
MSTPKKLKTFWPLFKKSVLIADNTSEGSTPQRLFWPKEFLTRDIPEARVWTYGYSVNVTSDIANNKNTTAKTLRTRSYSWHIA